MITFNNAAHGRVIASAAGCIYNPEGDTVISRSRGDDLLGGVIFRDFNKKSINIHVAGFDPHWINPDMLWVTFNYPFEQLGCEVIFGPVPESNKKAIEFDLRIGFREVARIADVFPDGDMIVMKMRREDCRWLKLKPRTLRRLNLGRQE